MRKLPPVLALMAMCAGCALIEKKQEPVAETINPNYIGPDIYANRDHGSDQENDVVRSGRYTLTRTSPTAAQEDLLSQIVEVTIPSSIKPSVGDAIRHALSRSGYSLCAQTPQSQVLYSRDLPAAHYKIGPMRLRDALQVLGGPAWRVEADEVQRTVCYSLRNGYKLPLYATSPVALPPAATPVAVASSNSAPVAGAVPTTAPITTSISSPAPLATTSAPAPSSPALTSSALVAPAKDGKPAPATTSSSAPTPAVAAAPLAKPLPTPVPVKPAAPIRPLPEVWTAEPGSTLRNSVEAWAKRADWHVIWHPQDLDYPIEARLSFEGSFPKVIGELFPLYDDAPRPFYVDVSPPAQRLIEVSEKK